MPIKSKMIYCKPLKSQSKRNMRDKSVSKTRSATWLKQKTKYKKYKKNKSIKLKKN